MPSFRQATGKRAFFAIDYQSLIVSLKYSLETPASLARTL